jgi:hypothetical protein
MFQRFSDFNLGTFILQTFVVFRSPPRFKPISVGFETILKSSKAKDSVTVRVIMQHPGIRLFREFTSTEEVLCPPGQISGQ